MVAMDEHPDYIEAFCVVYVYRKEDCVWVSYSTDWQWARDKSNEALCFSWLANYGAAQDILQYLRQELKKKDLVPIGRSLMRYETADFHRICDVFQKVMDERRVKVNREFSKMDMPPKPVVVDDAALSDDSDSFEEDSDSDCPSLETASSTSDSDGDDWIEDEVVDL